MRISQRALRRLQKQRHMYDINMMILNNPLFKNLDNRDQKTLQKIIYKAEMMEMFVRDQNLVRVNESFEKIIEDVLDKMDVEMRAEDEEDF